MFICIEFWETLFGDMATIYQVRDVFRVIVPESYYKGYNGVGRKRDFKCYDHACNWLNRQGFCSLQ